MSASDWVDSLRDELREDLAESREQPVRETVRLVLEGLVGLGLLLRSTIHVLVYIASTGQQPPTDGVEYSYVPCHVPSAPDDVAWRARLLTGLCGMGIVHWGLTMLGMPPYAKVLLGANAAVLLADPISPLWLRFTDTP